MGATEVARDLYAPILDADMSGLEKFEAESFIPCIGTILVVLPPKIAMTKGGVYIPDDSQEDQSVGKVVAVPPVNTENLKCPVYPGDWIVFRKGAGTSVLFGERKDLILLQYYDGPESDILGYIRGVDLVPGES